MFHTTPQYYHFWPNNMICVFSSIYFVSPVVFCRAFHVPVSVKWLLFIFHLSCLDSQVCSSFEICKFYRACERQQCERIDCGVVIWTRWHRNRASHFVVQLWKFPIQFDKFKCNLKNVGGQQLKCALLITIQVTWHHVELRKRFEIKAFWN